jgi:undecaprenyl-diphosphatase
MNPADLPRRVAANWNGTLRRLSRARRAEPPVDWRRAGLLAAAGVAFVVFVAIAYDARAIAWSHTLSPGVRGFFGWITRFGTSGWLLIPSGIIVIVVSLGDWRRVSRASAAAWWEIATFAAVLFAVVAASGIVTDIIKPIVGRARPDYVHGGVIALTPFSFGGYSHYSFPSGHATTMAAVAMLVAFVPSVVTVPVVIAAAAVAVSRVIIDAHFPSDVAGGTMVGLAVGYFILRWMKSAGLVFVDRRDGTVRRRFGVLRRLARTHGLSSLFPALWLALGLGRQPPPADDANAASRSETRSSGSSSPM